MHDPDSRDTAELHALEADLAYFEARLAFTAAAADTLYQRAQQKVYEVLARHCQGELERVRSRLGGAGSQD